MSFPASPFLSRWIQAMRLRLWLNFILLAALLGARLCPAQGARTAVINDPDGFTNVRAAASSQAPIIARVQEGEQFTVFPSEGKWWRVRTGEGREGFIFSGLVRLLDPPAAAPAEPAALASPAAADEPTEVVPGFRIPPADASPTEKFLHELAVAARRYRLELAYRPRRAADELDDSAWTRPRMKRVAALLQSPLGAAVPEAVREFCRAALVQDGTLQVITDFAFGNADRGRNEALDIARGLVRGIPDDVNGSNSGRAMGETFGLMFRIQARQQARLRLIEEFAAQKRRDDLHRRWAELLGTLGTEDAALRPYATRPAATDMSWHYLSNRLLGDALPSQAVVYSRSDPARFSPLTFARRTLGDLGRGPLRVRVRQRGTYIYRAAVTGATGKVVFVARCTRGHFGIYNVLMDSAWAARGMVDAREEGRIAYTDSAFDRPGELEVMICHLPLSSDDQEVDATLLIYPADRYRSDGEADAAAREVELR